jgi:hypothetical protein
MFEQLYRNNMRAVPVSVNLHFSNVEYISRQLGLVINNLSVDNEGISNDYEIKQLLSFMYVETTSNVDIFSLTRNFLQFVDEVSLSTIGFSFDNIPMTLNQEMLIVENPEVNFQVLPSLIGTVYGSFAGRRY